MSQKLVQTQNIQQVQTLSPQQVLQVRLLEMPVSELEQRVQNELMENGALEERLKGLDDVETSLPGDDFDDTSERKDDLESSMDDSYSSEVRCAMDDYTSPDDIPDYLFKQSYAKDSRPESMEYGDSISFYEQMKEQMSECDLTLHEQELMTYLIGSLDNDGLLRKKLSVIADELEIYNDVQTNVQELEKVLAKLQSFDPPGIGARDLQECLLLQLKRDEHFETPIKQKAYRVVQTMFEDFMRKRWDKISQKLRINEAEAERLQKELARLNPRPGSAMGEVVGHNFQQIIPDFIVEADDMGEITITLNNGNVPELRVSPSFMEILKDVTSNHRGALSRSEREALQYTRQKIEKANGFIEAVKQRRQTLMSVMETIVDFQRPFFIEGDETLLRPMILKDIAERTGLDISTVSRAANSKYVETNYGIYSLKWFFTDGYVTDDGREIATRKIQTILKEIIEEENKKKPLSDEELTALLNERGYPIARRTVAKYREQLGIPVARLRK
ncbi:MAG: RNA polymerase factor sigma-54 [Paraprevotella sp.]|nr:RNA polymerase factor sigma-54 [Paraprevotella sp.]